MTRKVKQFRQPLTNLAHVLVREWLVAKRKIAHLSQKDLADNLGVVQSEIDAVETGKTRLDVIELIVYCLAMDADSNELIELIERTQ